MKHLLACFALLLLAVAAFAQGDKATTTQNPDGTWTQIVVHGDQSFTQTEMDKDLHKTKVSEYDKDGKLTEEQDWAWNDKEKEEVMRRRRIHKHGNILDSEILYDENGVKVKETVWFEDHTVVDTYKGGKKIKRETTRDGKTKVERYSLAPTAALEGMVVSVPDRFAPGQTISFRVVSLKGEVVAGEPVQLSNLEAESQWTQSDENGVVTLAVPPGWLDLQVSIRGSTLVSHAATSPSASTEPTVHNPPKLIQSGEILTLHGDGFGVNLGDNVVTVGGKPAVVLGSSPHSLVVLAPSDVPAGPTDMTLVSNGKPCPAMSSTVVAIAFDAGSTTLTPGQRVTRTLRVTGTEAKVPIRVTDPSGDAARVERAGLRVSSGGPVNTIPINLIGERQGAFSLYATLDRRKLADWPIGNPAEVSNVERAEAAAHRAGVAAAEARLSAYFAKGRYRARNRKAAVAWRKATAKWIEAMHAWEDGDADRAKAAEAEAKKLEGEARDAATGGR